MLVRSTVYEVSPMHVHGSWLNRRVSHCFAFENPSECCEPIVALFSVFPLSSLLHTIIQLESSMIQVLTSKTR